MSDRLTASCRSTLTGWSAPGAGQESLRLEYLAHLAERERGWSRDCPEAHLTASSLIWSGGSVLLTLHAKLGMWLQTGGHIEWGDDTLEAAALREAREESGITTLRLDPDPLLLSRHAVPVCGYHLDVQYLVLADTLADPVFGAESRDVAWFPVDALPELDDSVSALVTAARARTAAGTATPAGTTTTGGETG